MCDAQRKEIARFWQRFADTVVQSFSYSSRVENVELRFGQRMRTLTIAVMAAVAVFVLSLPAQADDTAAAQMRAIAAKRTPQSLTASGISSAIPGAPSAGRSFASGFLYFPGAQSGLNVGGRVPVGKSRLYVPYYGNVSGDPAHPTVQGATGIAYGFRTWDISVLNGGFGTPQQTLPGVDPPKANPALSLSVRF